MSTHVILLKLTDQGIHKIKSAPDALDLNKMGFAPLMGVKLNQVLFTTGRYDIVAIVEAESDAHLARFVLTIGGFGNVRSETCRAFTEQEFRELVADMV